MLKVTDWREGRSVRTGAVSEALDSMEKREIVNRYNTYDFINE